MAKPFTGYLLAKTKAIRTWIRVIASVAGFAFLFSIAVVIAMQFTGLEFFEQIKDWAVQIWTGIKNLFNK